MSTGAVDRVNDAAASTQQQKTKNQGQNSSKSDLFSTLVKGQVPSNIVFTRVDKHLAVPKTAKTNDSDVPVTPARDDRVTEETGTVEPYETAATRDPVEPKQSDAAPKQAKDADATGQPEARAEDTAAAGQGPADANNGEKSTAPDASKAAAAQNGPAANEITETVSKAVVSDLAGAKQQAANTNAAAKPQDIAANTKTQSDLAGQDAGLAQKSANAAKGKVSKTEQAVAKPNTALTSETTVTAQTASAAQNTKPVQAGDGRPTATQLANAASDSEAATQSQQGNAQTKSSAAASKGAEKLAANQQNNNANTNSATNQTPTAAAFDQMVVNAAAQNSTGAQATNATVQNVGSAAADPVTGAGTVQNAQANSAARAAAQAAAAAKPKVPPQVVTDQVAVNINRAAAQGLDRISIQMRPSELGKVDVKMEVAHDGRVTAVITVERQETYDMLRGDSKALTQALQEAGLQADQNSLSFNLQGQGSQTAQDGSGAGGKGGANGSAEEGDATDDALLGLGEIAQADADGHYDVRV